MKKQQISNHDNAEDLDKVSLEDLYVILESSPNGLSGIQAEERHKKYGYNEIVEERDNSVLKFLAYFWGPIPWMIEVAMVLSAMVRHWSDFFIICFLLTVNSLVAFWEERQASNAIAALKKNLAAHAKVLRKGEYDNILASQLIPGDVISLKIGDIIPADVRIIRGDGIEVDQSALTGESLTVHIRKGEVGYSGSIVRKGEALAIVFAIAKDTYFNKSVELVQKARGVSHFQKAILKIGNYLVVMAVLLIAVMSAVAFMRGDSSLSTLEFSLVLLIAAIPVAMPTVLSVTLAIGSRILAERKAIVKRLVAIEELAGVDLLCSDKTGTLTQNVLTAREPHAFNSFTDDDVMLCAALSAPKKDRSAIDEAVIHNLSNKDLLRDHEVIRHIPFDFTSRRSQSDIKDRGGKMWSVTMGAPESILDLTKENLSKNTREVTEVIDAFGKKGFRTIAVAKTDSKKQWEFVGLIPLFDPPRKDAYLTIRQARAMGVGVKMITGDHYAIAVETARKLGLGSNVVNADDINIDNQLTDHASVIEKADVFAQVFPEQKFQILESLQQGGHIVSMTGDGVNDAPALKKADCGIAVYGATDAAKSAASIVLLSPGLSVILDAIKESRRIFQRMTSYATYRITETIRVLLFMTLAIVVFNFYPITAVMIVILALLNDGAIMSIAFDNASYSRKPETWDMRRVLTISTVLGVMGVVSAFILFFLAESVFGLDHDIIQTLIYLKLSVAGHLTVFLARTRGHFWSTKPANVLILAVVGTQIIATIISISGFMMAPIGWGWALGIWIYALIWFFINDQVKVFVERIIDGK